MIVDPFAGCETAADRARAERAAQGLPTPAAPTGDPVVDARIAAAYRTTATVMAAARPTSHGDPSDPAGVDRGAAAARRGSRAASRSSNAATAGADTPTVAKTRRPKAAATRAADALSKEA